MPQVVCPPSVHLPDVCYTVSPNGIKGGFPVGTFGGYTQWAVVFLIIFVLFFLLVPGYGGGFGGGAGAGGGMGGY